MYVIILYLHCTVNRIRLHEYQQIKTSMIFTLPSANNNFCLTRPSVRVHWVTCGTCTCTVPDNFFQVGRSLRPFKGSPRSHTSRGPLAHRSSQIRTTKQICPCIICSSNSAPYCFGIVYHCSAMVEVFGK